jgi:anti-sigma B factor antagonist
VSAGEDDDDAFRVIVTAQDGSVHVRAEGEFDLAACQLWESTVPQLVAKPVREVEVDLGRVSFMDSSGLGLLVKLRQRAEDEGMRLRLLHVPPRVMRVLEYSGVTALFDISAAELEPD